MRIGKLYSILFFIGGIMSVMGIILSITLPELEDRPVFIACFAGLSIMLFTMAVDELFLA